MKKIFYMCFIYVYFCNHEMDNPILLLLFIIWNVKKILKIFQKKKIKYLLKYSERNPAIYFLIRHHNLLVTNFRR